MPSFTIIARARAAIRTISETRATGEMVRATPPPSAEQPLYTPHGLAAFAWLQPLPFTGGFYGDSRRSSRGTGRTSDGRPRRRASGAGRGRRGDEPGAHGADADRARYAGEPRVSRWFADSDQLCTGERRPRGSARAGARGGR